MKSLLVGLFSFGVLVSCEKNEEVPRAVAVSKDGSMILNLMTFNLRYENDGDLGRRAWSSRVVGIVQLIRREEPDVLGFQEGLLGQVADLRVSLPDYEFVGGGRRDGLKHGEFAGLFFRKDRFDFDPDRSGMIWLSEAPEKAGSMSWGNEIPRVATSVKLTDRQSGQGLWVTNLHLDHRSQPSREKGVRLVAERFVEMNRDGDPLVLMGDFNATERNAAVRFIKGESSPIRKVDGFSGMKETYDELNAGETKRGTLHFWMSDPNRQWKVDHIFISKEGAVLASEVLRTGEPYLSDHFPVTARVRFPAVPQ
ncbi:MAG: endonuclease/exonuclease/phosphatase family protein [Akkermansiaceae bacterium]